MNAAKTLERLELMHGAGLPAGDERLLRIDYLLCTCSHDEDDLEPLLALSSLLADRLSRAFYIRIATQTIELRGRTLPVSQLFDTDAINKVSARNLATYLEAKQLFHATHGYRPGV